MKKRKHTGPFSPDFKNSPFRSLKGIAPCTSPGGGRIEKKALRHCRRIAHEDDEALFLQAMQGARRIGDAGESSEPLTEPPVRKRTDLREQHEHHLFLSAIKKIGANITDANQEEDSDESEPRSTTSRLRQVKRGSIRITRQLDLHGFSRDEALQLLSDFIVKAYHEGREAVLIITGKGINSPEGPVLRGAVDAWLRTEGKSVVSEFQPAPRTHGGKGAFVAFLKHRKHT